MAIRPEHLKTFPNGRIAETLLMFLRAQGGEQAAMSSAAIFVALADYYELPDDLRSLSRARYYTNDKNLGSAWESEVQEASKVLKSDGYLLSSARAGNVTWRLTPAGIDRADFWLRRMTEKADALKALIVAAPPPPANAAAASAS